MRRPGEVLYADEWTLSAAVIRIPKLKWITETHRRRWVYAIPTDDGMWWHSDQAIIIQAEDGFFWKIHATDTYGVQPSKRRAMWEIRNILKGAR